MTEDQKHQAFVEMMTLFERFDTQTEMFNDIREMPLSEMTPDLWENFRSHLEETVILFGIMKQSIQLGSKVIDNDAATAHLQAVVLAD